MSGPETAKFLRPMAVLSVAHSVCRRQPTSDADVQEAQPPVGKAQPDTGCYSPQTLVDQHRDLVFYPQVNWKPVQIPQDLCDWSNLRVPVISRAAAF